VFAFLVARRYLGSNPWQTALLIAGVALGVTAFVFITALIEGLAVRLTDDVTAKSAHVSVEPADRVARVLPSSDYGTEAVALVLDASAQADPNMGGDGRTAGKSGPKLLRLVPRLPAARRLYEERPRPPWL